MMENINNNRLYKKLNEYFYENIKLSFVTVHSVIIITKDDKFCEFRKVNFKNFIKNSMIALSDNKSKIQSLIEESFVDQLIGKQFINFNCQYYHTIALTSDGHIYCWGENRMLGNGINDQNFSDPKLNRYLEKENIIDMCGSYRHTMVLTINGDVYIWGFKIINSEEEYQTIPLKLNAFNDEKVKLISCGCSHSMVLLENGKVYSWGWMDLGQLKSEDRKFENSIILVKLGEELVIERISSGFEYSLLLTSDGDIYFCNWNTRSNIATSDQYETLTPIKISHSEKFADIAAHCDHSFSAAMSVNLVYYIWGYCRGEYILELKKTNFNSFNEIFEYYSQISHKPIEGKLIQFNESLVNNGKYIQNYIENEKLGEGSYGEVFKVSENYGSKDTYAVKKIKFTANYENEFMKELETSPIISELNHENIVKYSDFWLENYSINENSVKPYIKNFILYIRMELCDKSLYKIIIEIKNASNLASNETLTALGYYIASEIFIEILEGVNYLHKQNPPIIHRDLNPKNIMLKIEKQCKSIVKIVDLGLATIHEYENHSHTRDRGNLRYLAPEAEISTKYDTRADIYSLGIVSQELFFIDINRDYENKNENPSESILANKYIEISNLCDKMTRRRANQRPINIEEILEMKHLWALKVKEFDSKGEFENILNSKENNESFVFKLLKKKLISEISV